MITLQEIKEKTKCIVIVKDQRCESTLDGVNVYKQGAVQSIELLNWKNQPKDVQAFWKAYDYAKNTLNRKDLIKINVFYDEWIKDPEQFEPDRAKVIEKLSSYLDETDATTTISIENYDGLFLGTHHVGDFKETREALEVDFDIIKITENNKGILVLLQEDDLDSLNEFGYKANQIAYNHDRFFGDGKYWN